MLGDLVVGLAVDAAPEWVICVALAGLPTLTFADVGMLG
jgi:hypothetical protein